MMPLIYYSGEKNEPCLAAWSLVKLFILLSAKRTRAFSDYPSSDRLVIPTSSEIKISILYESALKGDRQETFPFDKDYQQTVTALSPIPQLCPNTHTHAKSYFQPCRHTHPLAPS